MLRLPSRLSFRSRSAADGPGRGVLLDPLFSAWYNNNSQKYDAKELFYEN